VEIKYGTEVIDRNGKSLGTVDHLMRNTLTGEVSKFIVCRKSPFKDVFLSPQDVLESKEGKIKVDIAIDGSDEIS